MHFWLAPCQGLGMTPNRSQRIFVVDDTGTPMINAQVEASFGDMIRIFIPAMC